MKRIYKKADENKLIISETKTEEVIVEYETLLREREYRTQKIVDLKSSIEFEKEALILVNEKINEAKKLGISELKESNLKGKDEKDKK